MTLNLIRTFTRDDEDETDIEVEFEFTPGSAPSGESGPPEHYDPGSGPEVHIVRAWLFTAPPADRNATVDEEVEVDLTPAERRRIEEEIVEMEFDEDDGPDPDAARDARQDDPDFWN